MRADCRVRVGVAQPWEVSHIAFLCGGLLLACLGCGPHTDRLPLSGTITLDGAPLDRGTIQFASIGEGPLQSAGAVIQAGEYDIPAEKGLLPGTYHVEISSPDPKAKPQLVRAYPGGPSVSVSPDRIPVAYNIESDKAVELTRDGANVFDFAIASEK